MCSNGIHRYLICRMKSSGVHGNSTESIDVHKNAGLVISSDMKSVNEICLVLKAMKRNSSFQARMT